MADGAEADEDAWKRKLAGFLTDLWRVGGVKVRGLAKAAFFASSPLLKTRPRCRASSTLR
jgi:hypothetical protein